MDIFKLDTRLPARHIIWPVLAGVFFLAVIQWHVRHAVIFNGQDFEVYRTGAGVVFGDLYPGKTLYNYYLEDGQPITLPFTYPPFAVMVFAPFAFLPLAAGAGAMTLLAVLAALWISVLVLNYARARGVTVPGEALLGSRATVLVLAALITTVSPWDRSIGLAQINALILLLVLLDLLRPATRVPRGVLIGIAGGIKLTPLAFGLILLMRRDLKGVLTLGITFAATVAAGFIFMPATAREFWFFAISDPSRVGNINYVDNISTLGWLLHLGLTEGPLLSALRFGLILALLAGVAYLIPVLHRRGMVLSQIALNGFLMVAMSPISWSHHNIWLPLLMVALWLDAFPTFFSLAPRVLRWVVGALAVTGCAGLIYGPIRIGIRLDPTTHNLDELSHLALVASALPIICLTLVVLAWVGVAVRYRRALAGQLSARKTV
ncbi:glycosyltransferase 87 family protein [Rothia nasimurium]|uniref:glycosyltransferase 87 family protein n=1 Tax=Rothia nasimurium TaxID=85336 RepID=UPI001EFFA716|nr:glycosyltransferase 87 family protein [Rothia nasimurium]